MKSKLLISVLVVLVLVTLMPANVLAASISTAGSSSAVAVPLTAAAATFNVTVPTQLPITVAADGKVTTASTVKIVNGSCGAVKVSNVTVAGLEGWATVGYDASDMAAEKVGSKKIALEINGSKTTGANLFGFTAANFPKMNGANDTTSDEMIVTYTAKVPAQSTALTGVSIANVTFTVTWDE